MFAFVLLLITALIQLPAYASQRWQYLDSGEEVEVIAPSYAAPQITLLNACETISKHDLAAYPRWFACPAAIQLCEHC